jgi:hypothetical protein
MPDVIPCGLQYCTESWRLGNLSRRLHGLRHKAQTLKYVLNSDSVYSFALFQPLGVSKEACTGFSRPAQWAHKLWGVRFTLRSSCSVSSRSLGLYVFRGEILEPGKQRAKRRETDRLCWIYLLCFGMMRAIGGIWSSAVRRAVVLHVPLRIVLTGRCGSAFSTAEHWHVYTYICSHHWPGRKCKFREFPLEHTFILSGVLKQRHQLKVVNLHAGVYGDEVVWLRSGMQVIPYADRHGVCWIWSALHTVLC